MKTAIVRHILVKDKDLAEQLKKKIHDGADFAKIAKQHSALNSSLKGSGPKVSISLLWLCSFSQIMQPNRRGS